MQTFDTFLGILSPSARSKIADLLQDAAAKAAEGPVRKRLEEAALDVRIGRRAAEPYDHAEAVADYQQAFKESYANRPPVPESEDDAASSGKKRTHPKILAQLDAIEAEMKKIGYWSGNQADILAASQVESFLDAPTFELWLQAVFVPRAREAATNDELPEGSQVGELARRQYDYMSVDYRAETLLKLLQHFDELIVYANRKRA